MSLTITYDREEVAGLAGAYDGTFVGTDHQQLSTLQHLLADICARGDVWSVPGRPDLDITEVRGNFYCNGEGVLGNGRHLSVALYLDGTASLAHTGIERIASLTRSDQTRARLNTTFGVLDAVVETVNVMIERTVSDLGL